MRKLGITLAVLGVLAVATGAAWQASEPEPLQAGSRSAERLAPGSFTVGTRRLELQDPGRPTQANGDFAGIDGRHLSTRLWFPRDPAGKGPARGPFPLLVWSHGFFGNNGEPVYLAEQLASHGWIVVAANFPLTSYEAPGGPQVFDVVNQPGDVSFLIDTLLDWSADPQHDFAGRVDETRIAIAGLSLGGMTTELTAFHPRLRDPRVKAAISVAGPLEFMGPAFFAHAAVPFMMIAGDIDAMIPYESNARPVLDRVPGGWLVTLAGASHTGFADQAKWLRWMDNADSIGCFFIKGKTPEDTSDPAFFDRLGTPEEGIRREMDNRLCKTDPLPEAISPLLQHRIVTLAAQAFLQSQFDADPVARQQAEAYLRETLPAELPGVRVERAPQGGL
jgi:predicted dienelactone hydrolase